METIQKICGWSGCENHTDINPKSEKLFYYCAEHMIVRKVQKKVYYKNNKVKWAGSNEKAKARWRELRERFLDMYGHQCACCELEGDIFLTLDHIHSDGKTHRAQRGNFGVYNDALANHQPERFQVLCYNCNITKSNYGACPHQLIN